MQVGKDICMNVAVGSTEYIAYARPLRPGLETIDLDAYESLKRVCGMAKHFFKVSGHQFSATFSFYFKYPYSALSVLRNPSKSNLRILLGHDLGATSTKHSN